MPYSYEVGFVTYEESKYTQLIHEKKFTEKEFKKIVFQCILKAIEEEIGESTLPRDPKDLAEEAMRNRLEGEEFLCELSMETLLFEPELRLKYRDLHKRVIQILIEEHGFYEPTYVARLHFWGWSDLTENDGWPEENSATKEISQLVQKRFAKRLKQNAEFQKKADQRNEALATDPQKVDEQDKLLLESLGVAYIPFNDPRAREAREQWNLQHGYTQHLQRDSSK